MGANQSNAKQEKKIQIEEDNSKNNNNTQNLNPQTKSSSISQIQKNFIQNEIYEEAIVNQQKQFKQLDDSSKFKSPNLDLNRFEIILRESPIQEQNPINQAQLSQQEAAKSEQLIQNNMEFTIVPRYTIITSNKQQYNLPIMVQLKTLKASSTKREALDLICVIDDSFSMFGPKAQFVRKSLRYILKILKETDRISLIKFDTKATILCPLLCNNDENKMQLKSAIKNIKGVGGTNIQSGLENALWMIQNRKYKNPLTSIFLLTDGQDQNPQCLTDVSNVIKTNFPNEEVVINCYGYGEDHDAELLSGIAKLRKGNFYFIQNLNSISQWFIVSLSGVLSIFAKDIKIQLENKTKFEIVKQYGGEQIWQMENDQSNMLNINFPTLNQESVKQFFLEILIPKSQFMNLEQNNQQLEVFKGSLSYTVIDSGKSITQNASCLITVNKNSDEEQKQQQDNEQFEVGYLHTKGADVIKKACALNKDGFYDESKKLVQEMISNIKISQYRKKPDLKFLMKDLKKTLGFCNQEQFHMGGEAFMYKKEQDHFERRTSLVNIREQGNEFQKQIFKDYEEGHLQLSDNSCKANSIIQRNSDNNSQLTDEEKQQGVLNQFSDDENDEQRSQKQNSRKQSLTCSDEEGAQNRVRNKSDKKKNRIKSSESLEQPIPSEGEQPKIIPNVFSQNIKTIKKNSLILGENQLKDAKIDQKPHFKPFQQYIEDKY